MNLGLAYLNSNAHEISLDFFIQALTVAEAIDDARIILGALINLGAVRADLKDFQEAIGVYQKALLIAQKLADTAKEGVVLWNMSLVYSELGDKSVAIQFAESARKIFVALDDPYKSVVEQYLLKWHDGQ